MSKVQTPNVLVVGAGSMGMVVGYFLTRAHAQVTYLVRPNRAEELDRTQQLYCYDDNSLKHYHSYKVLTDPSEISKESYEYVIVALDAASLQNEEGRALVRSMGAAFRDTSTKFVLGTVAIGIRDWFLETSGLDATRVTLGLMPIHAYPTDRAILEVHAPTNPALIVQADVAYTDRMGAGFVVLDTAPEVAKPFAELYNQCGVSTASVVPEQDTMTNVDSLLAVMVASELVDWPRLAELPAHKELWGGYDCCGEGDSLPRCAR
ncbi:hypothetical protein N7470_007865 [Penicillium chermesinum]|nr:hypothetical protein N7470_007865 [Penicillium chermesinum]